MTELLTGNLPPSVFFSPAVFLFLVTIGYGFPVLLLREFCCRSHLGVAGIVGVGLAYGIVNEGILAKTFYLATGVPVNVFDGNGFCMGISLPWAIVISVWHALHAFFYPIVLTYHLFPECREEPWLTGKGTAFLAVVTMVVSLLVFFGRTIDRAPGQPGHLALMALCMGLLLLVARALPAAPLLCDGGPFRLRTLGAGLLAFFALFFLPVLAARERVPVAVFCAAWPLGAFILWRRLVRLAVLPVSSAVLLGCGDYLTFLALGIVSALSIGSTERAVAQFLLVLAIVIMLAHLRRTSVAAGPGRQDALEGR